MYNDEVLGLRGKMMGEVVKARLPEECDLLGRLGAVDLLKSIHERLSSGTSGRDRRNDHLRVERLCKRTEFVKTRVLTVRNAVYDKCVVHLRALGRNRRPLLARERPARRLERNHLAEAESVFCKKSAHAVKVQVVHGHNVQATTALCELYKAARRLYLVVDDSVVRRR